jgi:hypothetical protein
VWSRFFKGLDASTVKISERGGASMKRGKSRN